VKTQCEEAVRNTIAQHEQVWQCCRTSVCAHDEVQQLEYCECLLWGCKTTLPVACMYADPSPFMFAGSQCKSM